MPRPKGVTVVTPPTRLARLEFAFFKGYLLGLEPGKLSHLYLPPGVDYRTALTTIQNRIIMQAHRQGRHAAARLLRIPPAALAENIGSAPVPTLEQYRKAKDPTGDFFTESELAKLFLKDYPHAQFNRRSQRVRLLRDRQLARLHELEAFQWDQRSRALARIDIQLRRGDLMARHKGTGTQLDVQNLGMVF